jgi:hypothetical protein
MPSIESGPVGFFRVGDDEVVFGGCSMLPVRLSGWVNILRTRWRRSRGWSDI